MEMKYLAKMTMRKAKVMMSTAKTRATHFSETTTRRANSSATEKSMVKKMMAMAMRTMRRTVSAKEREVTTRVKANLKRGKNEHA